MPRGILVEIMGGVYRMTRKNYKAFLYTIVKNNFVPNPTDYCGQYLGTAVKCTDMTRATAKEVFAEEFGDVP